ncbi:MAG: hypothetical protein WA970_18155 [Gammaproteobacteria bacterium]
MVAFFDGLELFMSAGAAALLAVLGRATFLFIPVTLPSTGFFFSVICVISAILLRRRLKADRRAVRASHYNANILDKDRRLVHLRSNNVCTFATHAN